MKILIVDDQQEWINNHTNQLGLILEGMDFEIQSAKSAAEGLNKALESNYDLIITDMEMESVSSENYAGEWLLKNLVNRNEMKNTQFLILSGAPNIDKIAKRFNVHYIPKYIVAHNVLPLKYKLSEIIN